MGLSLLMDNKNPERSPGFAAQVIDKIGSGDALLALLSVCLHSNLDEKLVTLYWISCSCTICRNSWK